MFLYYITDRTQFPGTERDRRRSLLDRMAGAAVAGVDYIQLREKDLTARELEALAREALRVVRDHGANTRLLINSRVDVALAVGADGVHLTASDISAADARAIWASSASVRGNAGPPRSWMVAASCHSLAEVRLVEAHGADFVVLAPVFEKAGTNAQPLGLEELRRVTRQGESPDSRIEAGDQRARIPVFALGGITVANAIQCIRLGASGIAGIRLFQHGNLPETVSALRQQL